MIANSDYRSETGSTDVYNDLTMVCINPKCDNYAGTNLNSPAKVTTIISNKVN